MGPLPSVPEIKYASTDPCLDAEKDKANPTSSWCQCRAGFAQQKPQMLSVSVSGSRGTAAAERNICHLLSFENGISDTGLSTRASANSKGVRVEPAGMPAEVSHASVEPRQVMSQRETLPGLRL